MRRVAIIVAGLAMAVMTGLAVMLATLLSVAASLAGARSLTSATLDLAMAFALSDQPARIAARALHAAGATLALICVAPVICAALIGEIAGLRSPLWYAGATALLACTMPLARGAGWAPVPLQPSAILPSVLSGLSAGLIYWLIAGRDGGAMRRAGPQDGNDGFGLAQRPKSGIDRIEP